MTRFITLSLLLLAMMFVSAASFATAKEPKTVQYWTSTGSPGTLTLHDEGYLGKVYCTHSHPFRDLVKAVVYYRDADDEMQETEAWVSSDLCTCGKCVKPCAKPCGTVVINNYGLPPLPPVQHLTAGVRFYIDDRDTFIDDRDTYTNVFPQPAPQKTCNKSGYSYKYGYNYYRYNNVGDGGGSPYGGGRFAPFYFPGYPTIGRGSTSLYGGAW